MKIFLAPIFSIEIEKKAVISKRFSEILNNYFDNKNYGDDLYELVINIICVSPNFEQFFSPRIPKYIKGPKTIISKYTKQAHEIEKCLEYDIKLDFETIKNSNNEYDEKTLASAILDSLNIFDTMKSKIKKFNAEKFKEDMGLLYSDNFKI